MVSILWRQVRNYGKIFLQGINLLLHYYNHEYNHYKI